MFVLKPVVTNIFSIKKCFGMAVGSLIRHLPLRKGVKLALNRFCSYEAFSFVPFEAFFKGDLVRQVPV